MPTEGVSLYDEALIKGALARIGLQAVGGGVVAISASALTDLAPQSLWKTWAQLESWPKWSKGLHLSARWLEKRDWEVGAKFEHTVNYGFPIGKIVSLETVMEVNPGQSVSWWKHEKGVHSCHVWAFAPLTDGRVRVSKAAVYRGVQFSLAKPFLAQRLRQQYQATVDGLIRAASMPG